MSEIKLSIGGRDYAVACAEGEEAHVSKLGAIIDAKVKSLGNSQAPRDSRNILFGALLIADELHELQNRANGAADESDAELQQLRDEADTAKENKERLAARVAELEDERRDLLSTIEDKDILIKRTNTRLDQLEVAASNSAGGPSDLVQSGPHMMPEPDLAPALERFADLLENCADKLERRV
ncbi:MAG: cell division protein ZapA [Pontixanthobacter sp.]